MPLIKQKIYRLSVIYRVLEKYYNCNGWINHEDLLYQVNLELESKVCKSSIEKDLNMLRTELRIYIQGERHGLQLFELVDFPKRMYKYLGLK